MIQYENIQKAMGVDIAVSQDMSNAIYKWTKMYMNKAPWLNDDIKSLNLPAAICSEMARLVTMELEVEISGSQRADYIKKSLRNFFTELPNYVEYACSCGGAVFKPYIDTTGIAIDVVKAGNFYPVAFDSVGNITKVIFPEFKRKGKTLYTRLEYHALRGNTYTIVNKAFVSRKAAIRTDNVVNLGREIPLTDVEEWKELAPQVEFQNADKTLFSYFKIPVANNIDMESPLGVSVYARACDQIRDADEQYGATLWEYRSKETAIQAADEFFKKDRNGQVIIPNGKERLYRAMGTGIGDDNGTPFFNAYSPDIRDQSFFNGYNKIVQKIEFNSGLAYGTLSDPQVVEKTAEEIKASKQRSYATVKAIQNSLEAALVHLIDAIGVWLTITDMLPDENVDSSFNWDDSLIVDKKYEMEQLRADVSIGAVGLVEYRMKRFGETKEQAEKMIAELHDGTME